MREINREILRALKLMRGVAHAEFIRAEADGELYFLECAARVGGAYIHEMVEAASDLSLWREWARIEIAGGRLPYQLPPLRHDSAGLILSLARQEEPDTSGYNDPEIVYRIKKHHHAGFILRAPDPARIQALLQDYTPRFIKDFLAVEPPPLKPVD